MAKKYYWLKLKDDWFNSKVIKKLRKIAGGDTYTIIYLKTLLLSLKNEGKLYYEGVEESFAEELALELDEDTDNVNVTLSFLQNYGLLEIMDTDEYILTEVPASIGSESGSAERMRRCRANRNKKLLEEKVSQCDSSVTSSDTEIEKEIRDRDKINTSVQNPGKQVPELEADVAAILLNDGTEWKPSQALFAEYVRLYPNVDVKQQFNEMRGWCLSNQTKRKTRRGVKRFVNGWLAREQDRASSYGVKQQVDAKKVNGFSGFPQRSYDMESLEAQLLGTQKTCARDTEVKGGI